MPPDPRPQARIVDPEALRRFRVGCRECAACGYPPGSVHHVLPKGERGDDVEANLVCLCGNGSLGCHGALHGSPYTISRRPFPYRGQNGGGDIERRDRGWVLARLGVHIALYRPDTVAYLRDKLGLEAGDEYLRRVYKFDS